MPTTGTRILAQSPFQAEDAKAQVNCTQLLEQGDSIATWSAAASIESVRDSESTPWSHYVLAVAVMAVQCLCHLGPYHIATQSASSSQVPGAVQAMPASSSQALKRPRFASWTARYAKTKDAWRR